MQHKKYDVSFAPQAVQQSESGSIQFCDPSYVSLASDLISELFSGKKDVNGYPKLAHSYAVGLMGATHDETVVGFLHDSLEDTDITEEKLSEMFPKEIVDAVKLLTRDPKQKYFEYIKDLIDSENKIAIAVKLNDLHHNLMRADADKMFALANRYRNAISMIESSDNE